MQIITSQYRGPTPSPASKLENDIKAIFSRRVRAHVFGKETVGRIVKIVSQDHVIVLDEKLNKEFEWDPKHLDYLE
jgi:hypothetical protein